MTQRIVVIGGGIEELSCAWALATRGAADVVVLERDDLCGAGTGKSSGVVRCHYGVASLAAMAWYGVQTFEDAAEALDTDIGFVQVGYVVGVGPSDVAALTANVAMQQGLGIPVGIIDRDDVAALWPEAHLDDVAGFAWEPRGGYGDAYRQDSPSQRRPAGRGRASDVTRRWQPCAGAAGRGSMVWCSRPASASAPTR